MNACGWVILGMQYDIIENIIKRLEIEKNTFLETFDEWFLGQKYNQNGNNDLSSMNFNFNLMKEIPNKRLELEK